MNSPEDKAGSIQRHRRDRMLLLVERLRAEIPQIAVDAASAPGGMATATVTLFNGYELSLALDVDLPEVFYEVVRFLAPGDTQTFDLEVQAFPGSTVTDRLILDQAIDLVRKYAALPSRSAS